MLSRLWPQSGHTTRAANVVVFQLLTAMARTSGLKVGFLRVDTQATPIQTRIGAENALRDNGVEVLEELVLPAPGPKRSALLKLLVPRRSDFYPLSIYSDRLQRECDKFMPDAVFIPWDEQLTALCAGVVGLVKFAYYGNPDHKAGVHRAAFDRRYGIGTHSWLRSMLYLTRLEHAHLDVMRRYELVGDVAANDALYYARKGHPNAFYIRNVWIDRFGVNWKTLREQLEPRHPFIVAASVGNVNGTANRYGLELLARDLLPALCTHLKPDSYEVHIFGAGELLPQLRALLHRPEVRLRGFVPDIDKELLRAHIFLCLNNASPYKVGHTRYLHAWSLGCPVVAHVDAALSMPEIMHGHNALLGASIGEIALQIKNAANDSELRRYIGQRGYETFRSNFTAKHVVPEIISRTDRYVESIKMGDSALQYPTELKYPRGT